MSTVIRRLVLLDDHPVVMEGIELRIAQRPGLEVVGSFTTTRDLIQALEAPDASVDLAIVDFSLGPNDVDGLNLLRALRARFPAVAVLVLSASFNPATVALALQCGAMGFISKSLRADELFQAIAVIGDGRVYLPAEMRAQLEELSDAVTARGAVPGQVREELTPREYEVLRCTLEGMSTTEISVKFSRAMSTISTQKKAALQKLGIRSDAELFKMRHLLEKN